MSILEQFHRDEQRVLDRLVDGELNADERCSLLAALDDEPGGWRRCALTFVESQSWRGQLSRLAHDPIKPVQPPIVSWTPGKSRIDLVAWQLHLAVAAGLIVAFLLGTTWRPSGSPLATDEPSATVQSAVADAGANEPSPEVLTLALGDNGEEIDLPLFAADSDAAQSLTDDGLEASQFLVDQLERAGLQVTRSQRFYPLDLSDGRQVVVPVEEVDIHAPKPLQL
jgi:hypothetical protein